MDYFASSDSIILFQVLFGSLTFIIFFPYIFGLVLKSFLKARFKKKYVKKYVDIQSDMLRQFDPITQDPFEEDDLVVVKCQQLALYSTWKYLDYQCPLYPSCVGNFKGCQGEGKKEIYQNKLYQSLIWYGLVSIFLGITLYIIIQYFIPESLAFGKQKNLFPIAMAVGILIPKYLLEIIIERRKIPVSWRSISIILILIFLSLILPGNIYSMILIWILSLLFSGIEISEGKLQKSSNYFGLRIGIIPSVIIIILLLMFPEAYTKNKYVFIIIVCLCIMLFLTVLYYFLSKEKNPTNSYEEVNHPKLKSI